MWVSLIFSILHRFAPLLLDGLFEWLERKLREEAEKQSIAPRRDMLTVEAVYGSVAEAERLDMLELLDGVRDSLRWWEPRRKRLVDRCILELERDES